MVDVIVLNVNMIEIATMGILLDDLNLFITAQTHRGRVAQLVERQLCML